MDLDRWQRVKALFQSALERRPTERNAFVAQASAGDSAMRAEVESLLASHENADHFVGILSQASAAAPPILVAQDSWIGRNIGSYRVVRQIGRGGMAVVYLGVRADDEYRKHVAIKLVLPGLDSDEVLRRFRNERQTLAALDHPNIVKLLDGGNTEAGLPYLVMDYVDGMPIDRYCDANRLSTTERLQLFRHVCGAVHYAHLNLVVHRDLKPSNILVTPEGMPKLLDFGIAKLLNPEFARTLLITQTNLRLMTPEYASPEQIRGEPITPATDVYALGVILYELLTGHRPYQLRHYTSLKIEKLICEMEPLKPSTAVTRSEEVADANAPTVTTITPDQVSRTREGDTQKLRRRLLGDLDVIVLKALRKEPQQRYTSADDFSADIRRHLEHLPIKARPSSLTYRVGKFTRRHTEAVAATLMLLLLLSGLTTWRILLSHVTPRRSVAVLGFKNLSGQSDETTFSTTLSELLTYELEAGGNLRTIPGEDVAHAKRDLSLPEADSLGRETLTRLRKNLGCDFIMLGSYLEQSGQVRLDVRLEDASAGETVATISVTGTEAGVLDIVTRVGGQLREKLGVAAVSATEAAELKTSVPASLEARRLYSEGLSKLRQFDALSARDLLQKAINADPKFALAHSSLAEAWSSLGYDEEAKKEAKRAFDFSTNLPWEERLSAEGRYYEATKEWDRAIDAYRRLFDYAPDEIDYGLLLANLRISAGKTKEALATITTLRKLPPPTGDDARIDLVEAKAAEALSDHRKAADLSASAAEKAAIQGARLLFADARLKQGWALQNLGEMNKATAALSEAKRVYTDVGNRGGLAEALSGLGNVMRWQGELQDAKRNFESALAISRETGDTRMVATALNNIAIILVDQGKRTEAKKLYDESLAISRENRDKRAICVTLGDIADIAYNEGDYAVARKMREQAITLAQEIGDRSSEAISRGALGELLMSEGDLDAAKKQYEQVLGIFRFIGDKRFSVVSLQALGDVALAQGDLQEARTKYEEAMVLGRQLGDKADVATLQAALAGITIEEGRPPEAEPVLRAAIQELRTDGYASGEATAETLLIRALLDQNKPRDAQKVTDRLGQVAPGLTTAVMVARVQAALGESADAIRGLESVLRVPQKGDVGDLFEARLALGEIEMKSGKTGVGRAHLAAVEKDAATKGFGLIARKAASALGRGT